MSTLIAQEDVEDLYRIDCKVLKGKTKIQTLEDRTKEKLGLSEKRKGQELSIEGKKKIFKLEQENEKLKLENKRLNRQLESSYPFLPGPSTSLSHGKQVMTKKETLRIK